MQIVICTGIGLVVVAAGIVALFCVGMGFSKACVWIEERVTFPDWLVDILVMPIMLLLIFSVLVLSRETGCKVIHFFWR
jgi:hypothetical protein